MRYLNWLEDYEKTDPEPAIDFKLQSTGKYFCSTEEMLSHAAWHRRMTDAAMKVKSQLE